MSETMFEQLNSMSPLLKNNSKTNYDVLHELIAGTFAGWSQVLVGHPFDTVKVKLQTQPSAPIFSGPVDCARQIIEKEKLAGLYRGAASPLLGVGACNAVIFASNGFFRNTIASVNKRSSPEKLNFREMSLAGSLTGASVAFVNCPVEFLKIQLQIQKNPPSHLVKPSLFSISKTIVQSQGFFGLYRGLLPTILRDVPSFAGYFATYHGLKNLYFRSTSQDPTISKLPAVFQLLFGGLAGIACWVVCYPQDVLKSRIQCSSIHNSPLTLAQAWTALRKESSSSPGFINQLRPFLRGATPTVARAFPANAATFMVYEAYINYVKYNA